jgi:hypothetical protein
MARCYPPAGMVISTGAWPDSAASDAEIHQRVDRLPIHSSQLKSVSGLVRWSYRAEALARELSPEFTWCGNLKPAGYPRAGSMPERHPVRDHFSRHRPAQAGAARGPFADPARHGPRGDRLRRGLRHQQPLDRGCLRARAGAARIRSRETGPSARGPAGNRSRALPARPRFARDTGALRPRRGTLAPHGDATGRAQRSGRRHQGHGAARRRLSGPGVHRGGRRRDQAVTRSPREIARRG